MKKLLALLVACTAMTCVFTSCGNDEKDESSVSKDTSVSDESGEEATAEPVTEEETEEVTEETTEEETDEDTETVVNENPENSDRPAFIGKWKGVKTVVDGEEVNNISGFPAYVFQVDFQEDGTVLFGDIMTELIDESDYTWRMLSDNEIEVDDEWGELLLFTVKDDYLVMSVDDEEEVYLSKVDEFTAFGDADLTAFLGKWEVEKALVDGEEVTDIDGVPLYVYQLDFKENGKVLLGEYMKEFIDETSCFWNLLSENEIEMIYDGDTMKITADGDYLIGTDSLSGDTIYLVSVDEFKSVSDFNS